MIIKTNHGTVYEALRRLRAAGALSRDAVLQTGKPGKQVFYITADGRRVLPQFAACTISKIVDEGAILLLARFGYLIPPQQVKRRWESRRRVS